MSIKSKSIGALFLALIIILVVKPQMVNNIYSTILGRLFLLGIVIFMSMNSTSLGLLVALAIIAASNQFGSFVEGMDNIGDDNTTTTGKQKVLTKSATVADLKEKAAELGVDKEDVKTAIASKDSRTIPVDSSAMTSEDVSAFKESMLKNTSTLAEGFCPYAASVF
jgi:hypothetical protein